MAAPVGELSPGASHRTFGASSEDPPLSNFKSGLSSAAAFTGADDVGVNRVSEVARP